MFLSKWWHVSCKGINNHSFSILFLTERTISVFNLVGNGPFKGTTESKFYFKLPKSWYEDLQANCLLGHVWKIGCQTNMIYTILKDDQPSYIYIQPKFQVSLSSWFTIWLSRSNFFTGSFGLGLQIVFPDTS